MKWIALLALLILVTACQPSTTKSYDRQFVAMQKVGNLSLSSEPIELTQIDGLNAIDDFKANSSVLKVKRVGIGASMEDVIKAWGNPDGVDGYPSENIINLRYDDKTANVTIVTFHIVDDSVERIVLKEGSNSLLATKVAGTIDDVMRKFGKPDKMETTKYYTIYYYYLEGLEVYHKAKIVQGWGLIRPISTPNISYNVTMPIPKKRNATSNLTNDTLIDAPVE